MATQIRPSETTLEGHLEGLNRIHRGKVRDIFAVDEHTCCSSRPIASRPST